MLGLNVLISVFDKKNIFKVLTLGLLGLFIVSQVLYKYIYVSVLDPFYYFVDVCLLCPDRNEYIVNFLRISFYPLLINVFAFLVKNKYKLIDKYYKYKDYLNYFSFYAFSVYSYSTYLFFQTNKFLNILFWLLQIVVTVNLLVSFRKDFNRR